MTTTYFIPLPILLKEPLKQDVRSTTKSQLYFMKYVENDYPIIDNIEIFIVRSSPGGLSFRFFPGPLTNTLDIKGENYAPLYTDIKDKIVGDGLTRARGMLMNHWNFNRFTFFYNGEVAPVVGGITFPDYVTFLLRNTVVVDEVLLTGLIFMLMQIAKFRLTYRSALGILQMDPAYLDTYKSTFTDKDSQMAACQIIQAYWITKETYSYNKSPVLDNFK